MVSDAEQGRETIMTESRTPTQDAAGSSAQEARYVIYGLDASYFTRKVLGFFHYKQIPYEYRHKTITVRPVVEKKAGTHLIPVVVTPEGEWLWDSTPIAFEMDRRFPDTALLPPLETHPVLHLTGRILEDFLDEWPTRQALHFRWMMDSGIHVGGDDLARDSLGVPKGGRLDAEGAQMVFKMREMIRQWGTEACRKVGADRRASAEMEGEFVRLIQLLAQHFDWSPYLLGERPSLADFALYGGLEAHFLLDPIPAGLIERHAPALAGWTERLRELVADDGVPDWPAEDRVPETLAPLLQYVGLTFHEFLKANRAALEGKEEWLTLDLGYGPTRIHSRGYAEKTRRATAAVLTDLPEEAAEAVKRGLDPLGVLEAYRL
ncbi:MAG: glutathione S-transferase family protein [Alphaproteobacteria bacterium]|nr:MAG: glutathione S-transferase family protein [Alphaproteobacteria bacterium]